LAPNSIGDADLISLKNSADEIVLLTPENKTYNPNMDGYYVASIGFENELDGTPPTGWSLFGMVGTVNVISGIANHNKVLQFHDTSSAGFRAAEHNFGVSRNTNGDTIEFWWRTTNSINTLGFTIYNEGKTGVMTEIRIMNGYFRYDEGTGYQNMLVCENNRWYHNKIVIDFTNKEFDWIIDGIHTKNNIGFYDLGITNIRSIYIGTSYSHSSYYGYVDAIGLSWETDYVIGDNLLKGILLSYTHSITLDWLGYSLNGQENKTISGAETIKLSSEGTYNIQLFCNDSVGVYYQSELRYFSIDFTYHPSPSLPLDLSLLIYIIIGLILVTFGLLIIIYKIKIKPKNRRLQTSREEGHLKKVIVKQESLQEQRKNEIRRKTAIELELLRQREKEQAIIEKIRKVMKVSTRVKMNLLRNYLKMNEDLFNEKIFDWAEQFGFTIDGDYLNIGKANVSEFIDELENQFKLWRRKEEDGLGKV
jgi:hypothetical protein